MGLSTPLVTFIRSDTAEADTLSEIQREKAVNINDLRQAVADIYPVVQKSVEDHTQVERDHAAKVKFPPFDIGDYVLVVRNDFHPGEKLALRWGGPRRILKEIVDYVFTVEYLRNGSVSDVNGSS